MQLLLNIEKTCSSQETKSIVFTYARSLSLSTFLCLFVLINETSQLIASLCLFVNENVTSRQQETDGQQDFALENTTVIRLKNVDHLSLVNELSH
jgi:hypothetical protein